MNELLSPIYYCYSTERSENKRYAEADSFWCFMTVMSHLGDRFVSDSDRSQIGINAVCSNLSRKLKELDEPVWKQLKTQGIDCKFFALKWLTTLFTMEFELPDVLRLWDSFLSDPYRFEYCTHFAINMLLRVRDKILAQEFPQNLQMLQRYAEKQVEDTGRIFDAAVLLEGATAIHRKYHPTFLQARSTSRSPTAGFHSVGSIMSGAV